MRPLGLLVKVACYTLLVNFFCSICTWNGVKQMDRGREEKRREGCFVVSNVQLYLILLVFVLKM